MRGQAKACPLSFYIPTNPGETSTTWIVARTVLLSAGRPTVAGLSGEVILACDSPARQRANLYNDKNRQTQFPLGSMTYRNTDAPVASPSHRIKTERKRLQSEQRVGEQRRLFASKVEFGVHYRNRPFSSQDVGGNGSQISAAPGHPALAHFHACGWPGPC